MGCRECEFYSCDGTEGYDYWWPECMKTGQGHLKNLKSFPFKKTMPCFQLNFWLSDFAEMVSDDEKNNDIAFDLYRKHHATNSSRP
jgi:hypothetical protein